MSLALCSTAACSRAPDAGAATTATPDPAIGDPAAARPASAAIASSAADWDGTYVYAFDGVDTAGGSAIVVTYTLALTPTSCRFSAEGYQTDEDILCSATRTPDRVEIAFSRYADGGTTDRYGNALYSPGDPLFALERAGTQVFTRWKGYTLPDEKPHRAGVYLIR